MRWGRTLGALVGLIGLMSCTSDKAGDVAGPRQLTTVAGGYTLVEERLGVGVSLNDLRSTKLIGLEGGTVQLLGHSIHVPLGAVSQPTLFTIRVVTNGYVEVDLTAIGGLSGLSGLGGLVDVGGQGFAVPVRLRLTYTRATNVGDPANLLILRKLGPGYQGSYEVMPSVVNPTTRTVEAELDHFSSYVMASG